MGFAPLGILNLLLGEFAPLGVFCGFEFAWTGCLLLFGANRRKRMSMSVLAIARNFFLFTEVLEKFQEVYGTF